VAHGLPEPTKSQTKAIMKAKAKVAAKRKGLPTPWEMLEPCSLEISEKVSQNGQAHPSYLDSQQDWQCAKGEATTSELCRSQRSSQFGTESPIQSFASSEKVRQTAIPPLNKGDSGDQQSKRYLPFACHCEQIFRDIQSLTDHIRLTAGYVYQCCSCLVAFRTPGLARKHVRKSKEGHGASTKIRVRSPSCLSMGIRKLKQVWPQITEHGERLNQQISSSGCNVREAVFGAELQAISGGIGVPSEVPCATSLEHQLATSISPFSDFRSIPVPSYPPGARYSSQNAESSMIPNSRLTQSPVMGNTSHWSTMRLDDQVQTPPTSTYGDHDDWYHLPSHTRNAPNEMRNLEPEESNGNGDSLESVFSVAHHSDVHDGTLNIPRIDGERVADDSTLEPFLRSEILFSSFEELFTIHQRSFSAGSASTPCGESYADLQRGTYDVNS
jgi:hypothetical protein